MLSSKRTQKVDKIRKYNTYIYNIQIYLPAQWRLRVCLQILFRSLPSSLLHFSTFMHPIHPCPKVWIERHESNNKLSICLACFSTTMLFQKLHGTKIAPSHQLLFTPKIPHWGGSNSQWTSASVSGKSYRWWNESKWNYKTLKTNQHPLIISLYIFISSYYFVNTDKIGQVNSFLRVSLKCPNCIWIWHHVLHARVCRGSTSTWENTLSFRTSLEPTKASVEGETSTKETGGNSWGKSDEVNTIPFAQIEKSWNIMSFLEVPNRDTRANKSSHHLKTQQMVFIKSQL